MQKALDLMEKVDGWGKLSVQQQRLIVLIYSEGKTKHEAFREAYQKPDMPANRASARAHRTLKGTKVQRVVHSIEKMTAEIVIGEKKIVQKQHEQAIAPMYDAARIKANLIRRLEMAVEFSLEKFTRPGDDGIPIIDFSNASKDDYWCLDFLGVSLKSVDKMQYREASFKPLNKLKAAELLAKLTSEEGIHGAPAQNVNIKIDLS